MPHKKNYPEFPKTQKPENLKPLYEQFSEFLETETQEFPTLYEQFETFLADQQEIDNNTKETTRDYISPLSSVKGDNWKLSPMAYNNQPIKQVS